MDNKLSAHLSKRNLNSVFELDDFIENNFNMILLRYLKSEQVISKLNNNIINNVNHLEYDQAAANLALVKQVVAYQNEFNQPLFDWNDLSKPITNQQFLDEIKRYDFFFENIK